ncbi:MAG: hypothetical protein JOY66_10110 [Acetobacteraceae bacterium]|nr:hypothetical protein [Acetobacteraceae bacterium]
MLRLAGADGKHRRQLVAEPPMDTEPEWRPECRTMQFLMSPDTVNRT